MCLALWGLCSVRWLSSRNESADQQVPGVDIVPRPCQVPANLLKNLNQKNMFFRLTPFAYDPFWGYAKIYESRKKSVVGGWGEASLQGQSTPTGRSFRPVRACVRAVLFMLNQGSNGGLAAFPFPFSFPLVLGSFHFSLQDL